jgi:outer membrane protein TolC
VSALRFPLKCAFALLVPRLSLCTALFVLLTPSLFAGEATVARRPKTMHLTLHKAVELALAKNFSLEVARFEPQIARQDVTRALGRFDPVFEASAQRRETTRRDAFTGIEHFALSDVAREDVFSAGLRGITPVGTEYDLGVGSANRLGTENAFRDFIESNAGITVRQPILQGFGTGANLAQLRIARNNVLVSEWQLKQRLIEVIDQTVGVYNDLHLAMESLRVARGFRDLAKQTLSDNTQRVQFGTMSPLDITTARAEVAAREENVIVSARAVKDNENFLKQLVTRDLESLLDVRVEIEPPPAPGFRSSTREGIREALELRPDYRQAVLEIERNNIRIVQARDAAKPRLDLQGSLDLLGFDNDFSSSLERVGRRDRTAWSVGAIFSVPIPNREGRASVLAAKLTAAQSLINLQRLEQQIVVEVDNSVGTVITSRERIESNQEARRLAEESLAAGEKRLEVGKGTTFEVLELQKKLAQAQFAELQALADYNNAVSKYERNTGTILRVHNVVIEDVKR